MEFYGVLDGGGNTIKNIYIPESKSCLLYTSKRSKPCKPWRCTHTHTHTQVHLEK